MKSTEVYLVIGSAGEYNSYSNWPVAVWTEKEKAEAHAQVCREKAKASHEAKQAKWESENYAGYPDPESFPEDPNAEISYNTEYRVLTVMLNPDFVEIPQ